MAALLSVLTLLSVSPSHAGQTHALLIGVSEYEKLDRLPFSRNDVEALTDILSGNNFHHAVPLVDKDDTNTKPLKRVITDFLRGNPNRDFPALNRDDRVLLFFSGHGFRHVENDRDTLYLCPTDFDPNLPAASGISIDWLRNEFANCRCSTIILIVDSCHAGLQKNAKLSYADNGRLTAAFDKSEKVVTLASCQAGESSYTSAQSQQSIFTHYLAEALRGHADRDQDGNVDVDELYSYVHERVDREANRLYRQHQRPVRSIGTGIVGVPAVCSIKPMDLDDLLRDMATQIARDLQSQSFETSHKLLPVSFAVQADPWSSNSLNLSSGAFGKYCGDRMQELLSAKLTNSNPQARGPSFDVLSTKKKEVVELLDQSAFTPQLLRTPELKLQRQLEESQIVFGCGIIRAMPTPPAFPSADTRTKVSLSYEIISAGSNRPLAKAGGQAAINNGELAMAGHSMEIKNHADNVRPVAALRVDVPRHPLQDPQARFLVGVRGKGEKNPRPGKFFNGKLYVPVHGPKGQESGGEEIEVLITHRDDTTAGTRVRLLRLLVDGLNTLPEPKRDERGEVVQENNAPKMIAAPVATNINHSRPWVLEEPGTYVVRGYVRQTGPKGEVDRFRVVSASSSLASQRKFTDQIGIVTAAFYEPNVRDKGADSLRLGIAPGTTIDESLPVWQPIQVSREICFLSLHYLDKTAWDELRVEPVQYMTVE
ncbi:MAG: caspase family protein [Planctomycetales bacterium]|nr:caspase family protein [Planctomycetales bacterium]